MSSKQSQRLTDKPKVSFINSHKEDFENEVDSDRSLTNIPYLELPKQNPKKKRVLTRTKSFVGSDIVNLGKKKCLNLNILKGKNKLTKKG